MNENNGFDNGLWFMVANRYMKMKEIEMTSHSPEEAAYKMRELKREEAVNMKRGLMAGIITFFAVAIPMFMYLASEGVF